MLIFTVIFGALGLHHFYLRSPQTGFLFIIFNILSLGFWYFFDIVQLSTSTSEELNAYGLEIPWWGPAGIAKGMWRCASNQQEGGGGEPPNPLWFLLYMILLPLLPLSRMIAGDPYNSLISVLNLTVIPFGWIMNILSGAFDMLYTVLSPADIFYNGIKRPFPFTMLGWEKDGFSKRLTGREKSVEECEDDSFLVRLMKGLVRACLPFLDKFLPVPITTAIQTALTVKEQVIDKAISTAQTGMKVATQVGKIATDVPVAIASGLAGAAGKVGEAVNEAGQAKLQQATQLTQLTQMGGGSSLDAKEILALTGIGALVGGAVLLNMGRSFFDAVHSVSGPTDTPPSSF